MGINSVNIEKNQIISIESSDGEVVELLTSISIE